MHGAETWIVAGERYERVRVFEVNPDGVTVYHAKGIKRFDLAELPGELQARFGYDAADAAAFRARESEDRKAALAAQRERLARLRALREQQERGSPDPKVIPPEEVRFYPEHDLRPFYTENGLYAKNQGRRPSCSIFALVSALEYEQARRTGRSERLSEEFLIWATLQLQPGIALDSGFNFPEVITALQTFGIPPHDLMPNTVARRAEDIRPTLRALEAARDQKKVLPVLFRRTDPHLVERLVGVLNQDKPVVVALRWPHWRALENNFLLKGQKPAEGAAHAVTLVGYRHAGAGANGTTFIFRNSYGYEWGAGGCGFVHASYLREHIIGAFFLRVP